MNKRIGIVLVMMVFATPWPVMALDPTSPYGAGASAPRRALTLESTLISESRRLAVINGGTYGVGDSIGRIRIKMIRRDHVVLERGGKTMILRLVPTDLRRTPRSNKGSGQ